MMITSQKFCFCNKQSFTIRYFLTFCSLLIAQHVLAQVSESFSDGDFANAPAWSGNEASFIVENGELRLKAEPVSGNAFLSTPSNAIQNASWECVAKMAFNPSNTNRTQVYILSDSENLAGAVNGYFVMIGDTPDEISLYRQSGNTKTKIIDGVNARANLSAVNARIKVTRDVLGNWELFSDVGLTGTYVSEGIAFDDTFTHGSWFGVMCIYTATRSDDFYFDEIVVTSSAVTDIIPPQIEHLRVVSSQSIELAFSEPLHQTTAESVSNYVMSPGSMSPQQAILSADQKTVLLSFNDHFTNGKERQLSVSSVEDVSGNRMEAVEKTFTYFQSIDATLKDIIITEVFADPEPSQGLPIAEFIEVFNRSENVFDLSGWTIGDESTAGVFSKMCLFPGEYLIVTSTSSVALFSNEYKIIGVPNFPSLNNSGDLLLLKDASRQLIDAVRYSELWYRDSDKQAGGWSLELIDPQNICAESENWTAADDERGGTPGKQNSVFANKPDLTAPTVLSVISRSETELVIGFNEKLEKTLPSLQQFLIEPSVEIFNVSFADSLFTSLVITLVKPLDLLATYSLSVERLYDCSGNLIQANKVEFGVPQTAVLNDILINEILFNPKPTGVDFVELCNVSKKFINLKHVELTNANNDAMHLSNEDRLIAPGQYFVVTTDSDVIIGEYPSSSESNFIDAQDIPSMNDDDGVIKLRFADTLIDSFSYSKSMHSPFIKDEEGVSLERISFSGRTQDVANWKSASSVSGFATPGFINSNSRPELLVKGEVNVEPEIFSPLEGQQDFVLIHYAFDSGGQIANIDILDAHGRSIFQVANNELLGTSGFFRWEGNCSDGNKARIGYYMVKFEVFDATGVVRVFKKRLAIASRF
jgi:hypothetical protein